ncbi:MAG: carboxypeptidase-like regulatory domain-containing protein [Candidatus Eremiobacteraeota bacterium]|nr:carboxypeptidase-like regulatory domain-containing protein [Candidatus Eremiobacteraeota bacterium]
MFVRLTSARPLAARASGLLIRSLSLAPILLACARGESRPAHEPSTAPGHASAARAGIPRDVTLPGIAASRPAYIVRPAADAGSIAGTVLLDGPAPPDTTVTPSPDDVHTCGPSLTFPTVETKAGGVADAVVWLVGVEAGKPLPDLRRAELALDGCRLQPHLIAMMAGGALNVHGIDVLDARLRFTRVEGGTADEPPGTVLLRVTTTDGGQVVPSGRVVAAPGTVEVRGELQPWLRAWILAFDHPYFATTNTEGGFVLDGVPPGTYQLVAWHDRLGRAGQQVTVGPGQTVQVTVRLGGR